MDPQLLRDTKVMIMNLLKGMSQGGALPGTLSGSQVRDEAQTSAPTAAQGVLGLGAQPAAAAPHLEALPVPVIAQPIASKPVMTIEEQKSLCRFIRWGPPSFSGAP